MSDVSGIPYMGPMGMGNFFAPPFGGGGSNMSAGQISSTYMPEIANNQNVVNNLYASGGGFGQLTNYYAQQVANSYGNIGRPAPTGTFTDYNAGGAWPTSGGGGGSVFDQGAMNNFALGGGGYNFPSIPNYSSGSTPAINWDTMFQAGGGLGGSPRLNLDDVQTWAGNWNMPGAGGGGGLSPGMLSGLGGLGGAGYTPSPSQPFDWSTLFGGGGGTAQQPQQPQQQPADFGSLFGRGAGGTGVPPPSSSDQTAGWGNAPTAMPSSQKLLGYEPQQWPQTQPQQQPTDFGSLFGQGVGGLGAGGASFGERFDALGGSTPMGDTAPSSAAEPGTRTYDFAPMFEGGGGGFGTGGADTSQLFGAQEGSLGGNAFSYNPTPSGAQDVFSQPADKLAEQARARLASLMGSGDDKSLELKVDPSEVTGRTAESAREAGGPVPPAEPAAAVPPVTPGATTPATEAYPGANPPRPPASVPFTVEPGKEAKIRAVQPRLSAAVQGGAAFLPPGYTVEAYSGARNGPGQAYHRGGHAMDVRIIGPDGPIPSEGADKTGMYTLLARGVKTWAAQNDPGLLQPGVGGLGWGGAFGTQRGPSGGANSIPDLMHFDLGGSRGNLQPDRWPSNLQPLTAEERNAMPAFIPELGANQVPLDAPGAGPYAASHPAAAPTEQRPGVNQGQNVTPPPADIPDPRVSSGGFNPLDAAANVPKGPSGVEKAQTFLNRSLESILQQHAPDKLAAAGFVLDIKQPLREALKGPFGGQILSGLQPKLGTLGLTRNDFDKAVADPRARFGGGFGSMGGEMPTPGAFTPYADFRQSPDFENRTAEQPSRDQLAELQTRGASYVPLPEAAATPLGNALGLGDLPGAEAASNVVGPRSSAFGFEPGGFGAGGYGNVFEAPDSPTWNAGRDRLISGATETTNITPGDMTQRSMGDPFNPENYNTLDQASDLVAKRAKGVAELRGNPDLMRTALAIPIAEIGPDIANRSDADIAGFYETMLNNYASGARIADFPTLASILSPEGYYEPIRKNQQSMRDAYTAIDNDPALKARIARIFDEVSRGSNVSNLSTQNSVKTGKFSEGGEGALQPQFGGVMGQYVPGPQEYYTSMLNPYNDPRATDFIGAGPQKKYREFYRGLMPPGQMPWETR